MPAPAPLNQDEVDAVLNAMAGGSLPSAPVEAPAGRSQSYDFGQNVRIVRGRMPTLEMINERFGRLLRSTLYQLLRRSAVIAVGPVQVLKFGEYVHTLHLPTSLNLVRLNPLRGTGLVVLDPKLVFALVDIFFGGNGRHAKIEGREFTSIENRLIRALLAGAFENLREAWSHVARLQIEHVGSEMNPHFANIVTPTEIVVVTRFRIETDAGGGELHITVPYSTIEPLREVLDAGLQSDRMDHDDRWAMAMREEIADAEIELRGLLGQTTLMLKELASLRAGDVIPIDFLGTLTLLAEGIPLFRGKLGFSRGQHAVKVSERVHRPGEAGTESPLKEQAVTHA